MDIGLNVNVRDYDAWFTKLAPAVPAFSRIFAPVGGHLPEFGKAPVLTGLPEGTMPWISHKDRLSLTVVSNYWDTLPRPFPANARYRWTYYHEAAPLNAPGELKWWQSYWRDLVAMHAEHPRGGEIELVNIQTAYALRFQPAVEWRDYVIPGITFGLDCYPRKFGTGYEPPESLFAMAQNVAREYGASWCVPELGAEPRQGWDRAAWFADAINYAGRAGCTAVGLWCGSETRAGDFFDYRPDNATLSVWRVAMGTLAA